MRARTWALLGGAAGRSRRGARGVPCAASRSHGADLFHAQPPAAPPGAWAGSRGTRAARRVRLLRDYVAWEPIPMLRRRGTTVLERMSRVLGQGDAA